MRPEERDAAHLWDMLDAARTIRDFTAGVELGAFLANRKLRLALERLVEIIGEAARRVSIGSGTSTRRFFGARSSASAMCSLTTTTRSSPIGSGSWRRTTFPI